MCCYIQVCDIYKLLRSTESGGIDYVTCFLYISMQEKRLGLSATDDEHCWIVYNWQLIDYDDYDACFFNHSTGNGIV